MFSKEILFLKSYPDFVSEIGFFLLGLILRKSFPQRAVFDLNLQKKEVEVLYADWKRSARFLFFIGSRL